ncbi:Choline/ethanolamine kinase [Halotydeus destructor]|nr:Choline/ethanolamine kinase [Halotydeus destructor]
MTSLNKPRPEHCVQAKELCEQFLPGNWNQRDNIVVTPISGGYVNFLLKCSLDGYARDENSIPHEVVVRFYSNSKGGEASEALACYVINEIGLGPKLLGLFRGGRVEEFIHGHNLPANLFRDKNTLYALANCLAKLHTVEIPVAKVSDHVTDLSKFIAHAQRTAHKVNIGHFGSHAQESFKYVMDYDSVSDYEWIVSEAQKVQSRIVFCHNDLYSNNIMIKESANFEHVRENDLVFLDPECALYTFRGFDTSLVLNEAAYDWQDARSPKPMGHLAEELETFFLNQYITSWTELNPELFDARIDNVQNLMIEQRLWSLRLSLMYSAWIIMGLRKTEDFVSEQFVVFVSERLKSDKLRKAWLEDKLSQL